MMNTDPSSPRESSNPRQRRWLDRPRLVLATLLATQCVMVAIPGAVLGAAEGTPLAASDKKPLMRDFMGINFHTFTVPDSTPYAQVCHLARDYHPYAWDIQGDTSVDPPFPLTRQGIRDGKQVDWTQIYGGWRKAGFTHIDASITAFDWVRDHEGFKDQARDIERYGNQFASFFGPSGAHPLVDSVEVENEPGGWPVKDYVELFKSLSAGVRAGDPKMKIATCCVSAMPDFDKTWEKPVQMLEGLEASYDVINMHTYSFKAGWPSFERANPEAPGIGYLKTVDAMIAYRKQRAEMAGKEIWITEFGYDAATPEALKNAPEKRWIPSTDLQQAQWLVRSYLVFSEMDVTRAYLYFFDDPDGNSFHGASGITRKGVPKPSFFAVRHLFSALGDYRFRKLVSHESEGLYAYEYVSDKGEVAWAAWSATSGKPDAARVLSGIPRKPQRIETLAVADGKPAAVVWTPSGKNAISVPLGESPIFIFFGPGG